MPANTAIVQEGQRNFEAKTEFLPRSLYSLKPGGPMWTILWAGVEGSGLGQLERLQQAARTTEVLGATSYGDLDALFGNLFQVQRRPVENYRWDPWRDQLTIDQWNQVESRDAVYRERLSKFLQSISRGGSPLGIQMAAEAACGQPCAVVEMWRYAEGQNVAPIGRFNTHREFVIVALESTLSESDRRAVYRAVERLKPVNSVVTVDEDGLPTALAASPIHATSPSEYAEVRVFGTPSAPVPTAQTNLTWLNPGAEAEAPLFAFLRTQETSWSYTLSATPSAWTLSDGFPSVLGTLAANVAVPDLTITVTEQQTPPGSGFLILVGTEQMAVTDRSAGATPGDWVYTVTRTAPVTHTSGDDVMWQYTPLVPPLNPASSEFGPWTDIGLADSPDNYPNGKYPQDPSKYDADGAYLYAWDSQADYVAYVTAQIEAAGGQVQSNVYRLPTATAATPASPASGPRDALAQPVLLVETVYYPGARSSRLKGLAPLDVTGTASGRTPETGGGTRPAPPYVPPTG